MVLTLMAQLPGAAMGRALEAAHSPYPPSFDNNPLVFGWALFARLLVLNLAMATVLRLYARNRTERLTANHPVYYHRMVSICFLWTALLASGGDVLTYLFWGEVSNTITAVVMLLSRLLDALTMIPFLMALFVPIWLRWLRVMGLIPTAPSITLNGVVSDMRVTWGSFALPLALLAYSAIGSAGVTILKYWLWIEHGRP